ncbi:MAG: hypothetical protein NUV80_03725 [Candidatus Berkelbacteria bacterium]|nr:hypothetical protein [Candidatus Berkelbacteria bacterium]
MAAQIGYYDTLKNVAGKVFTYLASITLTGADGKIITVTQDTALDEAVAMSSKAPKVSPVFTGSTTTPIEEVISGAVRYFKTVFALAIIAASTGTEVIEIVFSGNGQTFFSGNIRIHGYDSANDGRVGNIGFRFWSQFAYGNSLAGNSQAVAAMEGYGPPNMTMALSAKGSGNTVLLTITNAGAEFAGGTAIIDLLYTGNTVVSIGVV